jgi:hypothetical protein
LQLVTIPFPSVSAVRTQPFSFLVWLRVTTVPGADPRRYQRG